MIGRIEIEIGTMTNGGEHPLRPDGFSFIGATSGKRGGEIRQSALFL